MRNIWDYAFDRAIFIKHIIVHRTGYHMIATHAALKIQNSTLHRKIEHITTSLKKKLDSIG